MAAPTRGLDLMHYMQFMITPTVRGVITPGEELSPAEYYDQQQVYDSIPEEEKVHVFTYSNVPEPLGDVTITVNSIGCYNICTDGIQLYWDDPDPLENPGLPPWNTAPWFCGVGSSECADDDDVCRPDDCSNYTISFTILRQDWIDNFIGVIGAFVGYPTSGGCVGGSCTRHVYITVRFLSKAAVNKPDTYEQDLSFRPYHGWATWHTAIAGNQAGPLSKALGEWKVDAHSGKLVCSHEWAPPDDPNDKRYVLGGLTGIHQRPEEGETLGDLGHGSIVRQRIQGMTTRVFTETDCLIV